MRRIVVTIAFLAIAAHAGEKKKSAHLDVLPGDYGAVFEVLVQRGSRKLRINLETMDSVRGAFIERDQVQRYLSSSALFDTSFESLPCHVTAGVLRETTCTLPAGTPYAFIIRNATIATDSDIGVRDLGSHVKITFAYDGPDDVRFDNQHAQIAPRNEWVIARHSAAVEARRKEIAERQAEQQRASMPRWHTVLDQVGSLDATGGVYYGPLNSFQSPAERIVLDVSSSRGVDIAIFPYAWLNSFQQNPRLIKANWDRSVCSRQGILKETFTCTVNSFDPPYMVFVRDLRTNWDGALAGIITVLSRSGDALQSMNERNTVALRIRTCAKTDCHD